ncbi:MAG: hypothetical protein Fur009_0480 [Candidatus Microgenomates bacterium]
MLEDISFLLNKAYFYLKFRPRTEKEIRDYLYKKIINTHFSRADVEVVIEKLKDQDLINDEKFMDMYIKDRLNLKPKGKKILIKELENKGVPKELINKYFENNNINEEELAKKILAKRVGRYFSLDRKKAKEKAYRFLLSRGFSYETAKKTIEDLLEKE